MIGHWHIQGFDLKIHNFFPINKSWRYLQQPLLCSCEIKNVTERKYEKFTEVGELFVFALLIPRKKKACTKIVVQHDL